MIPTYGQIAYEAYYAASDGKSLISGAPLPTWDEQDDRIKAAWVAAGNAVDDAIRSEAHDTAMAIRKQLRNHGGSADGGGGRDET